MPKGHNPPYPPSWDLSLKQREVLQPAQGIEKGIQAMCYLKMY